MQQTAKHELRLLLQLSGTNQKDTIALMGVNGQQHSKVKTSIIDELMRSN